MLRDVGTEISCEQSSRNIHGYRISEIFFEFLSIGTVQLHVTSVIRRNVQLSSDAQLRVAKM